MQAMMDHSYDLSDKTREQTMAAKQRFESFKMGAGLPSTSPVGMPSSHGRSHSRSHSRNLSITSTSLMSNLSLSSSTSISSKSANDTATSPIGPAKQRPNSHHRRRSSVSTRRESAELMGVSLPDLPASKPEDNINLGDKDSIRRRALWALEGKPDVSYSKVEIPELVSPVTDVSGFNFPTKPSYPAGSGQSFGVGLSSIAEKRSSMGKYLGTASTDNQLGTLVEEEEEEEEEEEDAEEDQTETFAIVSAPFITVPVTPTVAVTKPSPARPRPASLNLRPLALTAGNFVATGYGGLPTPTLTPGPHSSKLKSLSLAMSPNTLNFSPIATINDTTQVSRRQSLTLMTPSPTPSNGSFFSRRPSLNINCDSPSPLSDGPKRHSSISYKSSMDSTGRNFAGLPTPEMTPIMSNNKQLGWTTEDEPLPSQRPLSLSEQHFLYKSHNALLARITDLEAALSSRSRSRPQSMFSDVSSSSNTSEPSDEMLSLLADLKSERDELKRDVDGWRIRVADLEDKVGVFAKRVETERRDAWVARSRTGLLEAEKYGLEKALEVKTHSLQEALGKLDAFTEERDLLKANNESLTEQVKQMQEVEQERDQLRMTLEEEMRKCEALQKTLESTELILTPTPANTSFPSRQSIDSGLTDVEPTDDSFIREVSLKSVAEEDEESYSDEDNGMAGYEDEEEADMSFESPDGSSLGSMDEFNRRAFRLDMPETPSLTVSDSSSESSSPPPILTPSSRHAPRNSLSRAWTFPSGCQPSPSPRYEEEEVDNFFSCIDAIDNSPSRYSSKEVTGKEWFSQKLSFGSDEENDDELPPFVIPSHVGIEVETHAPARTLDVLLEEEEEEEDGNEDDDDEFEGEEFDGGIRFTFNTPSTPDIAVTPPADSEGGFPPLTITEMVAPVFVPFDDEEDEAKIPFTFSQSRSQQSALPSSVSSSSSFDHDSDIDMSFSLRNVSPSSIPRATVLRSFSSSSSSAYSTPNKPILAPVASNSYVTPPSKRGGVIPSFIPQPVASPLRSKTASNSTFMRQAQRKPVGVQPAKANAEDTMSDLNRFSRSTHDRVVFAEMTTVPLSDPVQPPSTPPSTFSIMSHSISSWWTPRPSVSTRSIAPVKAKSLVVRSYVSREKQLEKLRSRLDQERKSGRHSQPRVDTCRTCIIGEVNL